MVGSASEVSINLLQSIVAVALCQLTLCIILWSKVFGCVAKKRNRQRTGIEMQPGSPLSNQTSGSQSPGNVWVSPPSPGTNTGGPDQPESQISGIQPQNFARDSKQMQIAEGESRDRFDYPTMADVLSDWDSTIHNKDSNEDKGNTSSVVSTKHAGNESLISPSQLSLTSSPEAPSTHASPDKVATAKSSTSKEEKLSSEVKGPNAGGGGEVLKVEPQEGVVSVSGGSIIFNLINLTNDRLVYKARCTGNKMYYMSLAHGFVEPKSSSKLEVQRFPGPPKCDRMEIGFRKAPADAQNAKELFANDNTLDGVTAATITSK